MDTDHVDGRVTGQRIHHMAVTSFLDHGRAPTVAEAIAATGTDEVAVRRALDDLAADHGVVLHPDAATRPDPVWVLHPFASAPTGVTVHHDGRVWFAPCVWCAFGVVGLVSPDGPAEVRTTYGGEGVQAILSTDGADLARSDADHVVHFPIPMAEAWRNVVHTCQVMQLFAHAGDVADWCARRGLAPGGIVAAPTVWAFAREWYGRHADRDWRKWSTAEAAAMFARHDLTGPTWDLPHVHEPF